MNLSSLGIADPGPLPDLTQAELLEQLERTQLRIRELVTTSERASLEGHAAARAVERTLGLAVAAAHRQAALARRWAVAAVFGWALFLGLLAAR